MNYVSFSISNNKKIVEQHCQLSYNDVSKIMLCQSTTFVMQNFLSSDLSNLAVPLKKYHFKNRGIMNV